MAKYLVIFLVFTLAACETHVFFKDSLPPGVPNLPAIPEAFVGTYQSTRSNTIVHIEDSLIFSKMVDYASRGIEMMFEESRCSGDEDDDYLSGRTCFSYGVDEPDSNKTELLHVDTLFSLCSGATANVFGSDLFLNYQNQYGEYLVAIVKSTSNRTLIWSLLKIPPDEKKIARLTDRFEVVDDRCKHDVFILDPTPEQFEKIVASEYLVAQDSLIPMELHTKTFVDY